MMNPSEIFRRNIVDCLKKYDKTKTDLAEVMFKFTDYGKTRKNKTGIQSNLLSIFRNGQNIGDKLQVAIVEAIRIIDIDNFSTPVEFCDMYTIDFFKE